MSLYAQELWSLGPTPRGFQPPQLVGENRSGRHLGESKSQNPSGQDKSQVCTSESSISAGRVVTVKLSPMSGSFNRKFMNDQPSKKQRG